MSTVHQAEASTHSAGRDGPRRLAALGLSVAIGAGTAFGAHAAPEPAGAAVARAVANDRACGAPPRCVAGAVRPPHVGVAEARGSSHPVLSTALAACGGSALGWLLASLGRASLPQPRARLDAMAAQGGPRTAQNIVSTAASNR